MFSRLLSRGDHENESSESSRERGRERQETQMRHSRGGRLCPCFSLSLIPSSSSCRSVSEWSASRSERDPTLSPRCLHVFLSLSLLRDRETALLTPAADLLAGRSGSCRGRDTLPRLTLLIIVVQVICCALSLSLSLSLRIERRTAAGGDGSSCISASRSRVCERVWSPVLPFKREGFLLPASLRWCI